MKFPLYFAPRGFKEKPTLKRSNAFPFVGEECRERARGRRPPRYRVLLPLRSDRTGSRSWLDWLMARLPKPGRARLAPMLSETGKLKGDLTLINWGDGTFWIEGSYYLRLAHALVRRPCARRRGVRDISDDMIGFALSGPKSRALLARVTHQDVSNAALPFMGATTLDVGLVRAKVARVSVIGELGYEINCRALEQAALRKTLLEAGASSASRNTATTRYCRCGSKRASASGRPNSPKAYTPRMTGMDRLIAWDKGEFVGRKAALAESKGPPP